MNVKQKAKDYIAAQRNVSKAVKYKRIATLIVGILLIGGFITLYLTFGKQLLEIVKDATTFKAWLAGFGGYDRVVFVAIRALQTVVKIIPAEPLEIGAGYAYGTWGGLLYCMLGTEIGSLVILLLTRSFGTKVVELFVPMEKINELGFLKDEKRLGGTMFLLYLIPSTPKDLFTYFAGLTKLNIPIFLITTGFARIPSIITSTWCGSSLGEKNYLKSALIFGATALVGIIGMIIYKKISDKKKASSDSDNNDTNSGTGTPIVQENIVQNNTENGEIPEVEGEVIPRKQTPNLRVIKKQRRAFN